MSATGALAAHDTTTALLAIVADVQDPYAAAEILASTSRRVAEAHQQLVLGIIGQRLTQRPRIAAVALQAGPQGTCEVAAWVDEHGEAHSPPLYVPHEPVSRSEADWWAALEELTSRLVDTDVADHGVPSTVLGRPCVLLRAGDLPSLRP